MSHLPGRNGHVLFSLPTPEAVLSERGAVVDVRIHGTGTSLSGSPIRTNWRRAVIDTALSAVSGPKARLCRTAIVETLNGTRRLAGMPVPAAALRPSPWLHGGRSDVPEYFAHQLHRLNAASSFHLDDDDDLAAFLAAYGERFGIGSQALVPVGTEQARRLAEGYPTADGLFASRLFRAYAAARQDAEAEDGEGKGWAARPAAWRIYDFAQWALGEVRLPASVLAPEQVALLNAPGPAAATALPLTNFYTEAYRRDEALAAGCSLSNPQDLFVILLAVTLWLIRWNQDEIFVTEDVRQLLRSPVEHDGQRLEGLGYFCQRLGIPDGGAITLDSLKALQAARPPASQPIPAADRPAGVNIFGYLNGLTAIGQNAWISRAAIAAAGYEVRMPALARSSLSDARQRDSRPPLPINLIHFGLIGAPTDMLNHGFDRFDGAYNIGLLVWETSALPPSARLTLDLLDEIWTPSSYCAAVFRQHFAGPVEVVPHAVDAAFVPSGIPRPGPPGSDAPFRFYFCFDEMSWCTRKNPAGVVDAFLRAFPAGDEPVELVVKLRHSGGSGVATSHAIPSASHRREIGRFRRLAAQDARIRLLGGDYHTADMAALMQGCDCYVSLHRAEGFGYTMAEAMMCGKPVIASRYSGNLDYMDEGCAFLVSGTERYMANDEYIDVPPGSRWFEPDLDDAAAAMCRVFRDGKERTRRAAAAAGRAGRDLSPEAVSRLYGERVRVALQRLSSR
ncbi:glycosyltransferase family 4 protein [Azospirillum humicireducens]|uniref:glycosyltransferase family 4 protein n=1 Tax=Azospirillum humicireducens TaxID=1226968 RepID=UPI0011B29C4B|nr:glycosyltransferase family 4 protein [Azospirillum humicireducens]